MKILTTNISKLALGLTAGFILASCGGDDDSTSNPVTGSDILNEAISENTTLSNDIVYKLTGGIHVKAGAVLTIEPGTKIISNPDEAAVAYLLVERGGMLIANGTEAEPIVFTSGNENPARGDWGGIIICGKAPINKGSEATAEVGGVLYGGDKPNDNSGSLKYIRVEYTGNAISDSKEHNGFTFNGVGNGTTLDYLEAYKGNDDGFEFFGGTVNAKHLISIGSKDDSFDWTYGWTGKGQFWLGKQLTDKGDRGIEGDNSKSDNTATPYSNPTLSNITLMGVTDAQDADNTGMRLREGTKGSIYNAVVTGFPKSGIRISEEQTTANLVDGSLFVKNSTIFSNGTDFKDCDVIANDATNTTEAATMNGITCDDVTSLNPSTLGSWFTSATYKGAVSSSNNWTKNWSVGL